MVGPSHYHFLSFPYYICHMFLFCTRMTYCLLAPNPKNTFKTFICEGQESFLIYLYQALGQVPWSYIKTYMRLELNILNIVLFVRFEDIHTGLSQQKCVLLSQ